MKRSAVQGLLMMFSAGAAFACICPDPSIADAFQSAHTVVVGVAGAPERVDGRVRVPLASVVLFKGDVEVVSVDDTPEDVCGFDMVEGVEYVLFLDSSLNALGCVGSRPIRPEQRSSLLKELRKISRRKT